MSAPKFCTICRERNASAGTEPVVNYSRPKEECSCCGRLWTRKLREAALGCHGTGPLDPRRRRGVQGGMMIDVASYRERVKGPGKFAGEPPETAYFYDTGLDGGVWVSQITPEEAEAFDLTAGHWFGVAEDSHGFGYGASFRTEEAAEAFAEQFSDGADEEE